MIELSLRERAYRHIRQKLLHGELPASRRISEVALAKEIGISRTPVREAVSQLASEGLVTRDPSLGVLVRHITRGELEELLSLRMLMERYAIGRAAKRMTSEQIAQLRSVVDHLRSLSHQIRDDGIDSWHGELGKQLTLTDLALHMLILQAADSPRVMKIIDDFHVLTTRYRHPSQKSIQNLARVLLEHWRLYRALAARDPKRARDAMRAHMRDWKLKSLALYDRQQRETHATPTVTDWSSLVEGLVRPAANNMKTAAKRGAAAARRGIPRQRAERP